MRKPERPQVRQARDRRALALCEAVREWQRLADQQRYPRSLYEILVTALTQEYRRGLTRGRKEAR